jgi:hypothetical protein
MQIYFYLGGIKLLQRSNRPVKAIVKAGIRYATCAKVWKHLGYDKTPVLGDPVREPERAGEIKRLTFMYRELFCMFVGGVINHSTEYICEDCSEFCKFRLTSDMRLMLKKTAALLPAAIRQLCELTGLNYAKEDLAYYKRRIKAYATIETENIYRLFCIRYGSAVEPFDDTFSDKVYWAGFRLSSWYLGGYKALK